MDSTDKERIYKEGVAADPVELDGDAEYTDLDAKQMIQRVGDSMYSSPKSAFRELYVNALSHGIMQRAKAEKIDLLKCKEDVDDFPHVEVVIDVANRKLTIHDIAGHGISRNDFTDITQFIGHSGNFDRERPGKWGMGIFSFLKLSSVLHAHIYSADTGESYQKISQDGVKWTMPRQDGENGRKKVLSKKDSVGGYRCKCGHPHSDMANKCTHPVNRVRPEKGTCECEKFEPEFVPVPADMISVIEPQREPQSGVKLVLVLKPEVKLTEMYKACKDIGTHWPVITRIQITEDIRKKQNVNKSSSVKGYGMSKDDQEDIIQEACLERIGRHDIKESLWKNVNGVEEWGHDKKTANYCEKHIETEDFSLDILAVRRTGVAQNSTANRKCPIFLLNVPIDVEDYVRKAIPKDWIWHLNIKNEGNLSPTGDRDRLSEQACEILYDELRRVVKELFQEMSDTVEKFVIPERTEKYKPRNAPKDAPEEERVIPENPNFVEAIRSFDNDEWILLMDADHTMELLTDNGIQREALHTQFPDRLHQFYDAITIPTTGYFGAVAKEWKCKLGDFMVFPRVMSIANYTVRQIEAVTTYAGTEENGWTPVSVVPEDSDDSQYQIGDALKSYRSDSASIAFVRQPTHTASNTNYEYQQLHFDMCNIDRATDFVKANDIYVAPEPVREATPQQDASTGEVREVVPISGIINVHSFPSSAVQAGKKHHIFKPSKTDTEGLVAEFNHRNTVLVYDCKRSELFGDDCEYPDQIIRMDNIRRWSYGACAILPHVGMTGISFIKGTKALRELLPNARTIQQFFNDIGNIKVKMVQRERCIPKVVPEPVEGEEVPVPKDEEIVPDKYAMVDFTVRDLMGLPLTSGVDGDNLGNPHTKRYTPINRTGVLSQWGSDSFYKICSPKAKTYLDKLGLPSTVNVDIWNVIDKDIAWSEIDNVFSDSGNSHGHGRLQYTRHRSEIPATTERVGWDISIMGYIFTENQDDLSYLAYYTSGYAMSEYRQTPRLSYDMYDDFKQILGYTRRGNQTNYNNLIKWWGSLNERLRVSLVGNEMAPFRNVGQVYVENHGSENEKIKFNLEAMPPRYITSLYDYDKFIDTIQDNLLEYFPLSLTLFDVDEKDVDVTIHSLQEGIDLMNEYPSHVSKIQKRMWDYLNRADVDRIDSYHYKYSKTQKILSVWNQISEGSNSTMFDCGFNGYRVGSYHIVDKLEKFLTIDNLTAGVDKRYGNDSDIHFTPVVPNSGTEISMLNQFRDWLDRLSAKSGILSQYIQIWNHTGGLMKFDINVFESIVSEYYFGTVQKFQNISPSGDNVRDMKYFLTRLKNELITSFEEVVQMIKRDVVSQKKVIDYGILPKQHGKPVSIKMPDGTFVDKVGYRWERDEDGGVVTTDKPCITVTNVDLKYINEACVGDSEKYSNDYYDIEISFDSNHEFGFGGSDRRLWNVTNQSYVFNSLKWDSFYVVEGALVLKGTVQLPFYEGEPKCHAGTSLITNEEVKVEDSRD